MSILGFGMQLPIQAQSTRMAMPWESGAGIDELTAIVRACDENGFEFVGVCDHIAIPRDLADVMSTTWFDSVATLGWLAGQTAHVRLLSHVYVVSYRHPLQTAKAFSTIDTLSRGRAILGVGAGHVEAEFEVLGIPFEDRGRLTDEAIGTIRAAFSDEFGVEGFGQRPRPVQPGGPPIWIGGSSPAARRRAARLGDGWLPQGPPKEGMAPAIAEIHRWRDEAGRSDRPFVVSGHALVHCGTPSHDIPGMFSGHPEEIAEQIDQLAGIGVTHVQVVFPTTSWSEHVEQIEIFGREVLPLVIRGAATAPS